MSCAKRKCPWALQNFSEIGSVRLVLGMATGLPTFARKTASRKRNEPLSVKNIFITWHWWDLHVLFKFMFFVPPFIIEFLLLCGEKRLLSHRWGKMRYFILQNNCKVPNRWYLVQWKYEIIWKFGFWGWERVLFHHMGIRMSVVFKEVTNRWCFGALSEIASGSSKELKASVIAHVPVSSALSYPAALLLSMRRFCVRMKHTLLVGR